MSGGLLKYSGLVTKTRAMHGRLLGMDELLQLSDYESVEDIIAFLRGSDAYAPIYESHEEIRHRGQVEAVINSSLFSDYSKLYQFAGGEQRRGLEIIFFRYEVNVLKACLKYASIGGIERPNGYRSPFFERHFRFPVEAAFGAGSIHELLTVLSGTPFEELIRRLSGDGEADYADYAAQLDIYYYRQAWRMIGKLKSSVMRMIFYQITGTEIDWLNIMWIYRSKEFYNMRPEEIYRNTIPVYFRLKKAELRKMADSETMDEFMQTLGGTSYFKDKDAVVKMGDEITFQLIMQKTYGRICRKYQMSIAPVLKYLYDKENEIDILTTILEGIRYQVTSRELRELVLVT